jgi:2,4-dienoyl-CoA reductase-like NADH-dependent reductase (Old Yellow Enzyme family)
MSILFSPFKLNGLELDNRFVSSACDDNLATEDGNVTDKIIDKYRRLAKGEVGLIISSGVAVHPFGRTNKRTLAIFSDDMISGLRKLVDTVHGEGRKILFQLAHGGVQAAENAIGRRPLGPSASHKNDAMNEEQIQEAIAGFAGGAMRAIEAGADGIQLHAAHGYLINEFLSPYFNHRNDQWGGSEENQFRFLRSIIAEIKKTFPAEKPLLIKLNSNDYTPEKAITPRLAIRYAGWLAETGVDGIEVSCGTTSLSPWNMCRGDVPMEEILNMVPESKKVRVQETLSKTRDSVTIEEGYNLQAAMAMRPVTGRVPLFAVGGWRNVQMMEDAVAHGYTDLISLCRPLIREPNLVKKIKTGKTVQASCTNCNRCLIALAYGLPGRCYRKGLPV